MRVVLVQVPPFSELHPIGGAEVVAATLAAGLARRHRTDVSIVCGGAPPPSVLDVVAGFELDDHVRAGGVIAPSFTVAARKRLLAADVVLSFERSFVNLPRPSPQIVVLGGVGYPHSGDVLLQGRWDLLVVPSKTTAVEAGRRTTQDRGDIRVVPNGVRPPASPAAVRRRPYAESPVRLLFPSHPTVEKGASAVAALVDELGRRGCTTRLTCLDQPDRLPGPDDAALPGAMRLPWCPCAEMADLYRSHDLTLCLSTVPEGFGLSAVESVLCGTPVLCSDAGNLPLLLPEGHGVFVVKRAASASAHAAACLRALETGNADCVARGAPYVRANYGVDRMIDAYVSLLEEVTSRRRSVRKSASS